MGGAFEVLTEHIDLVTSGGLRVVVAGAKLEKFALGGGQRGLQRVGAALRLLHFQLQQRLRLVQSPFSLVVSLFQHALLLLKTRLKTSPI